MAGVFGNFTFKNPFATQPPAPPQQPTGPGSSMQPHQPNADPNKIAQIPDNGTGNAPAQKTEQEPISPLDQFKDIWQTPTTKDGKQPVDPLTQPLLNTDPAKLAEAAKKMDFTQSIPPDLMQKALAGDANSLAQVINASAQAAFMASAQLNTQLVEGAVRQNNDRFSSTLEDRFRKHLVDNTRSENPVLNHPAAAPMLDLAKRQLLSKYPDKTPTQINQMAEQMFTEFATALTGETSRQKQQSNGGGHDPYDFSDF